MNWEAIGSIAEIIGGLAVLITLIYLGHQIKQTNLQGQAESERDWFAAWHDILRSSLGSPESVALMRRGLNQYETMKPDEKGVFSNTMICLCDHADVLRRLYEKGYVAKDVLDPVMSNLRGFILTPGGAQWWSKVGPVLTIYTYMQSLSFENAPDILEVMDYFSLDAVSENDD